MAVQLDLNNRVFQAAWFALEKDERAAGLQTCMKLAGMQSSEVYRDKGLDWEMVKSHTRNDGSRLYTILCWFSVKWRAGRSLLASI